MAVITRFALPLFLFHTTGMALSRAVEWTIFGNRTEAVQISWSWWLLRPVAIIGPLLATLPVIWLFGRRWQNKPPAVERHRVVLDEEVADGEVGDGGDFPDDPDKRVGAVRRRTIGRTPATDRRGHG